MVIDDSRSDLQSLPPTFDGSKCGRINLTDSSLHGRRVVHDGHFGTIHFVGQLEGTIGTWLGIDWDNPERGRHDGSYKGHRYFCTKTSTSGSFIRPNKVSLGTNLEEALTYRYVLCSECQLSTQPPVGIDVVQLPAIPEGTSTNVHIATAEEDLEFTGKSNRAIKVEIFHSPSNACAKNSNQHQHCGPQGVALLLPKVKSATLTLMPIYRALNSSERASLWPTHGGTLRQHAPYLNHLDLSGCLLTCWVELADICVQLPSLTYLNVSNNHLRLPLADPTLLNSSDLDSLRLKFDLDAELDASELLFKKAFISIKRLVLVRCQNLDWASLFRLLPCFPSILSLTLAYNELGNMPIQVPSDNIPIFHKLTTVDLAQTGITDLQSLFSLFGPSSALEEIVLNQNAIESLPEFPVHEVNTKMAGVIDPFTPTPWFPSLNLLGLRDTSFKDWKSLHQLLRLPHLKHLFFANCPVMNSLNSQTARQEIIARLPNLSILNRIEICSDERRGAELDYLKRYGSEWRASGGKTFDNSPPVDPPTGDQHDSVVINPIFSMEHPVFEKLCTKWGPPSDGESKLVAQTLKEGLANITFILQPTLTTESAGKTIPTISRRIHGRMTVNHLRMMIRRLFKIQPRSVFDLVAQGERHKKINQEICLDADTREIGYYGLEDGDTIYVRLRN